MALRFPVAGDVCPGWKGYQADGLNMVPGVQEHKQGEEKQEGQESLERCLLLAHSCVNYCHSFLFLRK